MVLRYIRNSTTWLFNELNALSHFRRHVNTLRELVPLKVHRIFEFRVGSPHILRGAFGRLA